MALSALSPQDHRAVEPGPCTLCGSQTAHRCSRCAVLLCARCGTQLNFASWAEMAELRLCRVCLLAIEHIR